MISKGRGKRKKTGIRFVPAIFAGTLVLGLCAAYTPETAQAEEGNSSDTLAVRRYGNIYYFKNSISGGDADIVVAYGKADDDILIGDWDGDGVDTICARRGNIYYFKNDFTSGDADYMVAYGKPDDEVLVGDWDGDGVDTLAARRGNLYYVKNTISEGEADAVVPYGRGDDAVLSGDWDGDGADTLAARRGNAYYIKNTISEGEADVVALYGRGDDAVLSGDWDGSGTDTLAVRRENTYYIKNTISSGDADSVVIYGKSSDEVYSGNWQGMSVAYEAADLNNISQDAIDATKTLVSSNPLTKKKGVVSFNGHRETYYSQRVLPGNGLNIPGRHVCSSDGTVRDAEGYICVASNDYAKGTVVLTSLGYGKVYDSGCPSGTIDIYVDW